QVKYECRASAAQLGFSAPVASAGLQGTLRRAGIDHFGGDNAGGNENVEYQLQSREPLQLRVRIQEGNAFKVCRHFTDLPAPDDFACRSCLAHATVKHRGFCSHTQEKSCRYFYSTANPGVPRILGEQ